VQFLGFLPCAAVAVFPEMLDHQTDIIKMTDSSLGMSKPKTLRMFPDQRPRLLDQLRRRGRWGGNILQGFRPVIHASTLRWVRSDRKNVKA